MMTLMFRAFSTVSFSHDSSKNILRDAISTTQTSTSLHPQRRFISMGTTIGVYAMTAALL